MSYLKSISLAALSLGLLMLYGCEGLQIHDTQSLLLPRFQASELVGFVAGLGTTFAALRIFIFCARKGNGQQQRRCDPRSPQAAGQGIWQPSRPMPG